MERIGVIGIGKLGLCLALHLEHVGYGVIGVDLSPSYIADLNSKGFRSHEPMVETYLKKSINFHATLELEEILCDDVRCIFIQVATPSGEKGIYDHSQIDTVAAHLIAFGKRSVEINLIVGCTTMPGFCDTLAQQLGPLNYSVNYNPEFIAQGSVMKNMSNPDLVLIGEGSSDAGAKIQSIYETICANNPKIHRMDRLSAEICKLAINCFLTLKISYANAIGDLAIASGVNPNDILSAVGSDSRIGKKFLGYGFGFGGPCLPRDNRALGSYANQLGFALPLSLAADEVNSKHLEFQLQQWMEKYGADETIEFDRVTYKDTAVSLEESQKLALAVRLAQMGRSVCIKERPQLIEQLKKEYGDLFTYTIDYGSK